jgi:N-methylhydantoinase A
MSSKSSFTVGIDVGGTFTDLLAIDPETREVKLAKVPTTVDNQAIGFMAALAEAGLDPAALQAVVHGTTTTTNALLERKIAKVGLITTKGFRDVLELGRRTRPQPYGLRGTFRPMIDREVRLEVPERMDADGKVLMPLDEAAVAASAKALLAQGCEAVVIHFLHSYINPAHERRARRDRARAVAQRLRHRRPRDPVRVSRVRARCDGGGERLGCSRCSIGTCRVCARSWEPKASTATCW